MFDIPELDDLVCRQLSQHDLTHCARVNKKWHALVVPYIWRSLRRFGQYPGPQARLFRTVVLEAYVGACTLEKEGHPVDQHIRLQPHHISTLSKHAPLIREFPGLEGLLRTLQDPIVCGTGQSKGPTEYQLATYLFNHCRPDVEFTFLEWISNDIDSNVALKALSTFALPRTRHVMLLSSFGARRTEYSGVKDLLSRCSTTLRKLDICLTIRQLGSMEVDDGPLMDSGRQMEWTSLREVSLHLSIHSLNAGEFLDWLCRQCGQVERMNVFTDNVYVVQNLARGMMSYMPHLREITLGHFGRDFQLDDKEVAILLSRPRTGWRRVKLLDGAKIMDAAMDALVNHFATLEELTLNGCFVRGTDLVQVLRHCNRLQRMIITNTCRPGYEETSRIGANAFVDQDPDTGELITWACEGSLRSLKVKIVDIPRPDLRNSLFVETYPGQGRDIHNQVYSRLARLTNLESLRPGSQVGYEPQQDCLEISLESGLHKLSGLKSLRELGIPGMRTRIGVPEVQWMVEQWPRVRIIHGIGDDKGGKRAKKWLRENHTQIMLF